MRKCGRLLIIIFKYYSRAVREAIIPSVEVTRRRMRINDVKNIQKERPLYIETHSWYLSSLSAALIPWLKPQRVMKLDCQGIFIGIYIFFFADLIYVTMRYIYCDVKQEINGWKKDTMKLITCRIIVSLKARTVSQCYIKSLTTRL